VESTWYPVVDRRTVQPTLILYTMAYMGSRKWIRLGIRPETIEPGNPHRAYPPVPANVIDTCRPAATVTTFDVTLNVNQGRMLVMENVYVPGGRSVNV
jgi:hypothetical protein